MHVLLKHILNDYEICQILALKQGLSDFKELVSFTMCSLTIVQLFKQDSSEYPIYLETL